MLELCPPDSLIQAISEHCNNPELSDVTIKFPGEGKELHAHQFVLSSQSEVFKKMLQTPMKEGLSKQIAFESSDDSENATFSTVEKALHFLYFMPIYCTDVDECLQLMQFAHRFMLTNLFAVCREALKLKVCDENVLLIIQFARRYEAKDLEDICWKCLVSGAAEIIKMEEFLDADEKLLAEFLEKDLAAEEIPLFESLLEWGRRRLRANDSDEIAADKLAAVLKELLPLIRFPQIEKHYLISSVKSLGIVPSDLYIEALEFIALGQDETKVVMPFNKRFKRRSPPASISEAASPASNQKRISVPSRKPRFR